MVKSTSQGRGLPGLLVWQYAVLGFAVGILGLKFSAASFCLLVLLVCLCVFCVKDKRTVLCILVFAAIGCGYAWLRLPEPKPVEALPREKMLIRGKVYSVQAVPGKRLRILLENVQARRGKDDRVYSVPGKLLWTWSFADVRPLKGQEVEARFSIKPVRGLHNPGGWDTAFYWQRQGVFYRAWSRAGEVELSPMRPDILTQWRESARRAIEGEGKISQGRALLLSLLLGDRYNLDPKLYTLFQEASIAHSLALSGLHLSFVASFGFLGAWVLGFFWPGIFLFIPRLKLGTLLAVPCVLFYLWLGGATPSLWRAGIMLFSFGVMLWLGRKRALLDGLFLALGLILCFSPLTLFDLRLQFSVLSVAGIILFMPFLGRILPGFCSGSLWGVTIGYFFGIFGVSVCATVTLLPLSLWYFGQVGVSLWVNMLWLPVLGFFILPAGFLGTVFATIAWSAEAGQWLLSVVAWVLDTGIAGLVYAKTGGALPVFYPMRPVWQHMVGGYGLAGSLLVFWQIRQKKVFCTALFCVGLLLWPGFMRYTDNNKLCLQVLDAGQSQALLLTVPGGGQILIDGGGSSSKTFDTGKAVVTPALTYGRFPDLKLAIMTHPDIDHYKGLLHPLKYFGRHFAFNGRWPGEKDTFALKEIFSASGIPVSVWQAGERHEIAQDMVLEVLHPKNAAQYKSDNDSSLVLRLVWQGRGLILFGGDVEQEGLADILASGTALQADILILPHHGSATSLSRAFYRKVNPKLAVATTGYKNYHGFPHKSVQKALAEIGIPLLDTGTVGQIKITWDKAQKPLLIKHQLPVKGEKQP